MLCNLSVVAGMIEDDKAPIFGSRFDFDWSSLEIVNLSTCVFSAQIRGAFRASSCARADMTDLRPFSVFMALRHFFFQLPPPSLLLLVEGLRLPLALFALSRSCRNFEISSLPDSVFIQSISSVFWLAGSLRNSLLGYQRRSTPVDPLLALKSMDETLAGFEGVFGIL